MGCIVSCLQNFRNQKDDPRPALERNASEKIKAGQDEIIPIAKPSVDQRDEYEPDESDGIAQPVSTKRSKTMDMIMEKQKEMEINFQASQDHLQEKESQSLIRRDSSRESSSESSEIDEHHFQAKQEEDANSDYDELIPNKHNPNVTVTAHKMIDDDYDEPVPSIKPKVARSVGNILAESDYDNPQPYSKSVNDLTSVRRQQLSESDYDELPVKTNTIKDQDLEDYDELPVRKSSRPVSSPAGDDIYDELPIRNSGSGSQSRPVSSPIIDEDYDELPVRRPVTGSSGNRESIDEVYDELPSRNTKAQLTRVLSEDDYDIPRAYTNMATE